MKKKILIILVVALMMMIFTSLALAGADDSPTYIGGRIMLVYPGAQLALQAGNVNYLLTGKTDGMRNYVGRNASVYGVTSTVRGLQYVDVYSYQILQ